MTSAPPLNTRTGAALLVCATQAQEPSSTLYSILTARDGLLRPVAMQAGYAALAAHRGRGGEECSGRFELSETDQGLALRLALLDSTQRRLAQAPIHDQLVQAHGISMAQQAGWDAKDVAVAVEVLDHDHDLARAWRRAEETCDFEVSPVGQPLTLPSDVVMEAPSGRRTLIRDAAEDVWLRCVLTRSAFQRFLAAAAVEVLRERAWFGRSRGVHMDDAGRCYVMIDDLVEVKKAAATRHDLRISGSEIFQIDRQVGGRLSGFLHLHPTQVTQNGARVALSPEPSLPDLLVARNLGSLLCTPVVLVIALFGVSLAQPRPGVAAHGFVAGCVEEIPLEVLEDQ